MLKLMALISSCLLIHKIKLLISLLLLFSTATKVTCRLSNGTDRLALLSFKELIAEDPLGSLSSWNHTLDLCNWDGVTCSHNHQRVLVLDLRGKSLSGTISPFLGNLSFLKSLHLQGNRFQGKIPLELGRLFRLQQLNLSRNSLQGEIPTNLSNSLSYVDLSFNDLVGKVPASFGSLTKLTELWLDSNNLIGGIPPSFGNISLLQIFSLTFNNINGTIPHSIGRLPNLQRFGISANELSGTVPPPLYNISTLTHLYIGGNQLTGCLPQDIGLTLPNLQGIVVAENQFWGRIPVSISNASRMEVFDLSINNLSGLVPFELGRKMKELRWLSLGENNLGSGDATDLMFINSLTNCSKLRMLDFNTNGFGGVLPISIANLSSHLNELRAKRNQLVGSIPVGISNLVNLTVLSLEQNIFSGVIPFEIGMLRNLQTLAFFENKLSGPIPASIGNLTRIFKLYLGDNNLNGTIPSNFGLAKFLSVHSSNNEGGETNSMAIKGSIGYVAPEYGIGGRPSKEGDVYSFGILVLEMLIGKRPADEFFTNGKSLHEFCRVALPERVMEIVDSSMLLEEPIGAENESVKQAKIRESLLSLLRIGIACSSESPGERMNIKDVIVGLLTIKEVFLGVGNHARLRMQLPVEGKSGE
ncbi:hypothetical protein Vadar_014008 [Vaccinium darrowii]|uniref:Uncharacterized protein n=1 Tax=Vaccinium darrowii TaxID=229202 RepID=A0ACB7XHU0_9ERIC|nr:hypothetical protein Vadar_014008 [Vaccinium darrowii]